MWEKIQRESGCACVCMTGSLRGTAETHNLVNKLYFNKTLEKQIQIGHEYLLPERSCEHGQTLFTEMTCDGWKRVYMQSKAVPALLLFAAT